MTGTPADLTTPEAVVNWVFARFDELGGRSYSEEVTELQHALQCAALAVRAGESAEMVAACLLHDFGHLVHGLDEDVAVRGIDGRHEEAGFEALRGLFPDAVVEPGRLHVAAKRYLCATDSEYVAALSPASAQSLELQGGAMSRRDCAAFEREPFFREALILRRYDDLGKDPDLEVPDLASYRATLESLAIGTSR